MGTILEPMSQLAACCITGVGRADRKAISGHMAWFRVLRLAQVVGCFGAMMAGVRIF